MAYNKKLIKDSPEIPEVTFKHDKKLNMLKIRPQSMSDCRQSCMKKEGSKFSKCLLECVHTKQVIENFESNVKSVCGMGCISVVMIFLILAIFFMKNKK